MAIVTTLIAPERERGGREGGRRGREGGGRKRELHTHTLSSLKLTLSYLCRFFV